MTVRLLTEHHLEFLSLKVGCTGLSESKLVYMPHCWKSNLAADIFLLPFKSGIILIRARAKTRKQPPPRINSTTKNHFMCLENLSANLKTVKYLSERPYNEETVDIQQNLCKTATLKKI